MATVYPLTRKAIRSIHETGYLNVWEGAVRSGKTVASELAWIAYITASPENRFIMSGKTQGSLFRNVIGGDYGLLAILGDIADYRVDREGNRILTVYTDAGKKECFCFGANDDSSYKSLTGFTAGGWYGDEINHYPRSFTEEALRRTIVSTDRRHFWTLNPDNPRHYVYTEYLDRYAEDGLPGYYYWHFTLDDNQAISEARKAELRAQYAGVFYRRYILGERCVAEGVIYGNLLAEENVYTAATRPNGLEYLGQRTITTDYGTTNPCVFLDIFDDGDTIWIDREYYWDSRKHHREKEDSEYADDLEGFIAAYPDFPPMVIVDPSAASFQTTLRARGMLVKDADNDVMDGIRRTSTLLKKRHIRVNKDACPETVKEFSSYAWNEKSALLGKEEPIKVNDHAMDALRYYVNTCVAKWRVGD